MPLLIGAIGPEIAPGVPWTVTEDELRLCLALKSGNVGDDDFFEKAVRMLPCAQTISACSDPVE